MSNDQTSLNRRAFLNRTGLSALTASCLGSSLVVGAEATKSGEAGLRVAVVTGGHPYDVLNFNKLFRALAGVDAYIQHLDDFATTPEAVRDQYDVVLFYHMLMAGPPEGPVKATLEHLGATQQGIVVLHHALLAYPEWPVWSDIVGIKDRKFGFHYGQTLQVHVAKTDHPITRGLAPWTMGDETYTMADAAEESEILLKVEHPKSMKTLAWTRTYKKSRVFCLQSGHDNITWANPGFREVLHRGMQWSARRS